MIQSLLLLSTFALTPSANADVDWFGTVTFTQTLRQERTTNFPAGHAYHPGTEIYTKTESRSGTVRYLPGRKSIVSANYRFNESSIRRTNKMLECPWRGQRMAYHDYEDNITSTDMGVNNEYNGRLNFRVREDGTYRVRGSAQGGNHIADMRRYHNRREFYDECSTPHLRVNEQNHTSSDNMGSLSFDQIAGTADVNAQELSGTWSGPDGNGGHLTYSWNLTRSEPPLVARATATSVERGGEVRLSATTSTGRIDQYKWKFAPMDGCLFTAAGATVEMTGPQVSFRALCDFKAYLSVSNDANADSAQVIVVVRPRTGDAWKTKFQTRPGPNFTANIFADQLHLGVNQCTLHGGDVTTGHQIHTDAANNSTWREGGYVLAQVTDQGPFQTAWFVESQALKIDRHERINSSLLAGGDVYALNQRHGNLRHLTSLVGQVRAHENTHSALVQEALSRLGRDGDPAYKIEKMIGVTDEDDFQFLVDFEVRAVETILQEATEDANVAQRLRGAGYTSEVSLWTMTRDGNEFLKALGPLWGIGH